MSAEQQNAVIEQVVHQQTLHPRDRLAAILMIVFAQRAEEIASMTWDQITITAHLVTIKLAGLPIDLPPPLDEPVRTLAASNYNSQTAAHSNSPWVFRGYRPGMHITPATLRNHLRPVLAALEARLGTLNELTQTTPDSDSRRNLGLQPADARRSRPGIRVNLRKVCGYSTGLQCPTLIILGAVAAAAEALSDAGVFGGEVSIGC